MNDIAPYFFHSVLVIEFLANLNQLNSIKLYLDMLDYNDFDRKNFLTLLKRKEK